jgi:hypothetical protein
MKLAGASAIATLVSLLAACPVTPRPDGGDGGGDGAAIEEHSDLFVDNPEEPGQVVFETNDSRFWGPYGYTLWALRAAPAQQPFASREVTVSKISGDASAGFGLVFCHYDDPVLGATMLIVMINTQQEYIVGEAVGSEFREIVPWTDCTLLAGGYGGANTLAVTADGGDLVLAINGGEACRFRDDEVPLHAGGADGYLVVISPQDDFPEEVVHVVFEEAP